MEKKFTYQLNAKGYPIAYGYTDKYPNELTGNEPFTGFDIAYYKNDPETGGWVDIRIFYKYIIIPCEMLPDLNSMVDLVEDVDFEQFDVKIEIQNITTRSGNNIDIPNKTIKFFICKLLKWDDGDKEQVAGIIQGWNASNPDRIIDFDCTFENEDELKKFIATCE